MLNPILFNYSHCSPADFKNDLSFEESRFEEILDECFLVESHISKIEVIFEVNPAQATEKFSTSVIVSMPQGSDIYVKEVTNDNFAQNVQNACHKTVRIVRENAEKHRDLKTAKTEL
jgi:hypothetical protein